MLQNQNRQDAKKELSNRKGAEAQRLYMKNQKRIYINPSSRLCVFAVRPAFLGVLAVQASSKPYSASALMNTFDLRW